MELDAFKFAVVLPALKAALVPVLTYAFKLALSSLFILIVLFAFSLVGLLPQSPFRLLNQVIATAQESTTLLRYLPVFIPLPEILMVFVAWVHGIMLFYGIKTVLRMGKVIT